MSGPTTTPEPMRERETGSRVAAYLDEGVEAGTLFKVLSRTYGVLAAALVALSFFPSMDNKAVVDLGSTTAVAHYDSGNLWTMLAKASDLGALGMLLMLALVVCGLVAAFRRTVPRLPGLDLAIAVLAALFILLLVTKPDYGDAEPELLLAGELTVAVLAVTAVVGLITIMEALACSPGRRS